MSVFSLKSAASSSAVALGALAIMGAAPASAQPSPLSIPPEAGSPAVTVFTGLPSGYRIISRGPSGAECERGNAVTTYRVWKNYPQVDKYTTVKVDYGICPDEYVPQRTVAYDEQDSIELGDFNFDGALDLALYVGNIGGYGSMAYDVFLYDDRTRRYIRSQRFSELTRSLGMFEVNKEDQMLFVNSKSGAAFFQREGYRVGSGNRLKKVYDKTTEYTGEGEGVSTTTITMDGQEFTVTGPAE